MRDLRKLRSKYELKLDNRHIAYLLVAELVIVGLVFSLGVVVGKSITRMATAENETPAASPTPALAEATPQTTPDTLSLAATFNDQTPGAGVPGMEQNIGQPMATPLTNPTDMAPALPPEPGKTKVEIGALPGPPTGGDYWTVQVKAFQDPAGAQELQTQLGASGNRAYVETADLGERGTWYRVCVGQYATEAGARAMAAALRERGGFDPWVRYVP